VADRPVISLADILFLRVERYRKVGKGRAKRSFLGLPCLFQSASLFRAHGQSAGRNFRAEFSRMALFAGTSRSNVWTISDAAA
jgi:hypothetical protein